MKTMTAKDALVETIRTVPITGKTYEEYVEALAEKFFSLKMVVIPKGAESVTWTKLGDAEVEQ